MITYVCELLICFRAALCENLPRVTPAQVKQPPYKNFTKRSFRASRTGRPLPWPQECSEHASEYSATHVLCVADH